MPPKKDAPEVSYRFDDVSGEHQIGVTAGGVFVPFVTMPGQYYADRHAALKGADAGGAESSSESEGQ